MKDLPLSQNLVLDHTLTAQHGKGCGIFVAPLDLVEQLAVLERRLRYLERRNKSLASSWRALTSKLKEED